MKDNLSESELIEKFKPVAILLLGMGLGLFADLLIDVDNPTGLGFLLWTIFFGAATCCLGNMENGSGSFTLFALTGFAITAALALLLRSSPVIIQLMWLVMVVAMGLVYLERRGHSLLDSTIGEFLVSGIRVGFQSALGTLLVLAKIDFRAGTRHPRFWSVLRGALLALPLLLVFGLLFSSADAAFNRLMEQLFNIFSPTLIEHLFITLVFGWLSTGMLAGIGENKFLIKTRRNYFLELGTDEVVVLMGLVIVIFLVFVYLQLGYLFGGRETIENASGLTLADYARRGFFELLAVAGLSLILLISVANSSCNQKIFQALAAVLLACIFVIQASAVQRLLLYIDEFGLTIDRVTALTVLLWTGIGLVLFAATLLRGQTRYFAAGLTAGGVLLVFLLALLNPAAVVARVNLDRSIEDGKTLDLIYLLSLGTDAIPTLMEDIDILSLPDQCIAANLLLREWQLIETAKNDWRSWNISRASARNLLSDNNSSLLALAERCVN